MQREIWPKIKQEIAIWRVSALPGFTVIGLVIIARLMGSLQFLEWRSLDAFNRLRPTESKDERIVIVGIDETDIEEMGSYPIPDGEIAQLLETLQTYQPTVIGLSLHRDLPVEPGHTELLATFEKSENLIAVEKVLPAQIHPLPGLKPEQVGFSDFPLDADLQTRRSFLGIPNLEESGDYKFSLALRLARIYLSAREGLTMENGIRDPNAMRFGNTELPRFFTNSGGYVGEDAGGVQVLLNFRNRRDAFRILSLSEIKTGNFEPDLLRDRIVIIGITAPLYRSKVHTSAIAALSLPALSGAEFQAHAVSQILSAVLDGRPLLKTWSDGWEYLWILSWGFFGIVWGNFTPSMLKNLCGVGIASFSLVGMSYALLVWGWWIPVIPALVSLIFSDVACTAFSEYDRALRARIDERQSTIARTFNVIHNGPLQTLANILRHVRDWDWSPEKLVLELEKLNKEFRAVSEQLEREFLTQEDSLYLGSGQKLDLNSPMHELFYEVYSSTLERDFPGFKAIRIKAIDFEPLKNKALSIEHKRAVCRFLEEALCNVGKHARGATRLEVIGRQNNAWYTLRITDNGPGIYSYSEGQGTQQSQDIKTQLRGKFKREPRTPKGTLCELTWPLNRSWLTQFSREKNRA